MGETGLRKQSSSHQLAAPVPIYKPGQVCGFYQDHPAPVWMVLPIPNVTTSEVSTALPQRGQLGSGPNLRPFLMALGHV